MEEIKKFEIGKMYAKLDVLRKASRTDFIKITNVGKVFASFVFVNCDGTEYTVANMARAKIRIDEYQHTEYINLPIGLSNSLYYAIYEK